MALVKMAAIIYCYWNTSYPWRKKKHLKQHKLCLIDSLNIILESCYPVLIMTKSSSKYFELFTTWTINACTTDKDCQSIITCLRRSAVTNWVFILFSISLWLDSAVAPHLDSSTTVTDMRTLTLLVSFPGNFCAEFLFLYEISKFAIEFLIHSISGTIGL